MIDIHCHILPGLDDGAFSPDESLLMGVIKDEMAAIRDKFADDRRTELTHMEGEIDIEDLIQADDMVVTMSHMGYVKRLPKSTYRAQHRGGKGVTGMSTRDEDFVERMIVVNTHDEIMFFTNRGRVYNLKCYQIPEAGRTARGMAIVNLLQLDPEEKEMLQDMIVVAINEAISLVVKEEQKILARQQASMRFPF